MNPKNNISFGSYGEKIASQYLTTKGYDILERNFKKRYGDIDIIAKENEVLVFIEVKTRRNLSFGYPEESITPRKVRSIEKYAEYYLNKSNHSYSAIRIDMVSILFVGKDRFKIKLYKNISG